MTKAAVKKEITLQDIADMIVGSEARLIKKLEKKIDDAVDTLAASTAKGFAAVDKELFEIKQDVSELKTDVAELKYDVSELKQDVSVLKNDVSQLKDDSKYFRVSLLDLSDRSISRSEFDYMSARVSRLEEKQRAKR